MPACQGGPRAADRIATAFRFKNARNLLAVSGHSSQAGYGEIEVNASIRFSRGTRCKCVPSGGVPHPSIQTRHSPALRAAIKMKPTPSQIILPLLLGLLLLNGCSSDASRRKERQAIARAMFEERCKKAGVTIHRTVENVEGIYILKLRPTTKLESQFVFDDPYGRDSSDHMYLLNFLRGFYHQKPRPAIPGEPPQVGYLYIEAVDPQDGKRYRYTGRMEEPWQTNKKYSKGYTRFVLDKTLATGEAPRYGVTYDDISTREEREYWIAGSSLRVVDLQTGETIAERIGYMMDSGQGSRAGARTPWLAAASNACPGFHQNSLQPPTPGYPASSEQAGQTLIFVEKVLTPSK